MAGFSRGLRSRSASRFNIVELSCVLSKGTLLPGGPNEPARGEEIPPTEITLCPMEASVASNNARTNAPATQRFTKCLRSGHSTGGSSTTLNVAELYLRFLG